MAHLPMADMEELTMSGDRSRREFLRGAALGAGLMVVGRGVLGGEPGKQAPSDKLAMAIVGVGGRGRANIGGVRRERIVALCDIDDRHLAKAKAQFPDAKTYHDWRKMFDQKDIDAVVCSTTDHTHAFVSVWAMRRGKHVYCEKPLAHSVYEARVVQETYVEKAKDGVRTQMGTQIHATENYRRVVELVRAKAIGDVREAHVWCSRRGPCPKRPAEGMPVPDYLHWDLWLGPAPYRPYHKSYMPGCMTWEQHWDWGNGCIGDMGSHLIDLPFWALALRDPLTIESEGTPRSDESYPHWLKVHWEHPAIEGRAALKLHWYDGPQRPTSPPGHDLKKWSIGVLFVGDKGMLLANYRRCILLPEDRYKGFKRPAPSIPRSKGQYGEWIHAAKTGEQTLCNFDYSGKLVEHNLLGTVAFRANSKLEWDPKKLAATNCPAASAFIRRPYREGWTLLG